MKHLKSRQEYIDRYDKITVERCRWAEKSIHPDLVKKHAKEEKTEPELLHLAGAFNELHLYLVAGEMYSKKEGAISEWMKKDEERDYLFENAQAPKNINCLICSREMFVSHKHLDTSLDKDDRVMFMYDCTLNHTPRRAFYDNGEEWKYEKPVCKKCSKAVDILDENTKEVWKSTQTCQNCGHVEISEVKKTNKEEKHDPDFEKDRERFCSQKEGEKYVEWMRNAKQISEYMDKQKEKENNKELYDAVVNLKKLKIIELEELLRPVLEKESFVKLHFKDPEITRDVVVPFTAHDIKEKREDRSSCLDLQKLIKDTLENTNWRLMSDGVNYRLGMLDGRLRAYEKEEDLVKLIKN